MIALLFFLAGVQVDGVELSKEQFRKYTEKQQIELDKIEQKKETIENFLKLISESTLTKEEIDQVKAIAAKITFTTTKVSPQEIKDKDEKEQRADLKTRKKHLEIMLSDPEISEQNKNVIEEEVTKINEALK